MLLLSKDSVTEETSSQRLHDVSKDHRAKLTAKRSLWRVTTVSCISRAWREPGTRPTPRLATHSQSSVSCTPHPRAAPRPPPPLQHHTQLLPQPPRHLSLAAAMTTASPLQVRQNYHRDSEATIDRQINLEL
ncbi:Ferritin heavy chain [Plecturocebus cupreus]